MEYNKLTNGQLSALLENNFVIGQALNILLKNADNSRQPRKQFEILLESNLGIERELQILQEITRRYQYYIKQNEIPLYDTANETYKATGKPKKVKKQIRGYIEYATSNRKQGQGRANKHKPTERIQRVASELRYRLPHDTITSNPKMD